MDQKKILISVDLSKLAADVVAYGCRLATALGAEATIIHAVPSVMSWKGYEPSLPAGLEDEMEHTAQKKLADFVAYAASHDPSVKDCVKGLVVVSGNPTEAVTAYASEHHFSMIVVGYRGQSAIERLLVGSTASSIARYAEGSVLIYRPGGDNI